MSDVRTRNAMDVMLCPNSLMLIFDHYLCGKCKWNYEVRYTQAVNNSLCIALCCCVDGE